MMINMNMKDDAKMEMKLREFRMKVFIEINELVYISNNMLIVCLSLSGLVCLSLNGFKY